jgi:hypothetical protein
MTMNLQTSFILWSVNCTMACMIERCLLILLAVALIGSLGGFFLYVPILPNLAVTAILGGLCAMFWLGFRVGMRPRGQQPPESNQLSIS